MEQGHRYDFGFDTLPPIRPDTGVNQQGFTAFLGASNPLDPGDAIRVELFADNFAQPPFYSREFTVPTTLFAATIISQPGWQDLQGRLSLTMVSGTAILERLPARVIRDNLLYEADVVIPEPTTFGMLLLGVAVAARRRR
jgi:hypothetical protein